MGKKSKIKSNRKGHAKRSTKGDCKESEADCQTLVSCAEHALSQMQIENALGYYEQALSIDPLNCSVMDSLADVYLSLGERGRALELLQASTQASPEDNPSKYLYIAQLQQGEEALASYTRALHFLSLSRQQSEEAAILIIDKQIIKCHCGITELYLTDLCYNENAEQQCDNAISQALSMDPNSIDANHALANVRLSQNRPIDAAALVETVFQRIHDIRERINARTIVEDLHAPQHTDFGEHVDEPDIPSLEICVSTVKMMLECVTIKPSLAEDAVQFATELLNDDDENVELWYIAGVAAMSTTQPDFPAALQFLEHAKAMIDSFKEFPDFEDGAMDEHYSLIQDHLAMIRSQQQGLTLLQASACPAPPAEEAEEWSDGEEEDDEEGGSPMDI